MIPQLFLAQDLSAAPSGGAWSFLALVLLIVFLTLIVTEGPKNNDH